MFWLKTRWAVLLTDICSLSSELVTVSDIRMTCPGSGGSLAVSFFRYEPDTRFLDKEECLWLPGFKSGQWPGFRDSISCWVPAHPRINFPSTEGLFRTQPSHREVGLAETPPPPDFSHRCRRNRENLHHCDRPSASSPPAFRGPSTSPSPQQCQTTLSAMDSIHLVPHIDSDDYFRSNIPCC